MLIIGDYTARVGDPSGRDSQRPILTPDEIDANAKTFQDQAFKVLDREATEVRFNSEWLDMPAQELFQLMAKVTVARLLEREDFTRRMQADQPISSLELLYPILQGYDSVAIRSDVELGGTDQKFNLLFARDIQRAYEVPEQSIMTMPILPGIDGVRRMSKSLDNYVGVTDPPEEMFGKLMRIPDEAMGTYYELLLGESVPEGDPMAAKTSCLPGVSWSGSTTPRPPRPPRPGSTPCTSPGRSPRTSPSSPSPKRMASRRTAGDVHLPALHRRRLRHLEQRGETADRAGRREARRRGGRPPIAWTCRQGSSAGACSRSGNAASSASILEQGRSGGLYSRSLLLRITKGAAS